MSYMKRFAEQVAAEMGKSDITDPEVLAEAQRRIDAVAMAAAVGGGNPEDYLKDLKIGLKSISYWQAYKVLTNGEVRICRMYDQGHSMKCKWTAFINDHNAHGTPGKWRVAEDTDTRKVVAYNDTIVKMVVFQLITIDTLVEPPVVPASEMLYSLGECVEKGTHLTDCDDDGYCNYCGEQ